MNRALLPLLLIIIAIATFFWWTNPNYTNVKNLQVQLGQSNEALANADQLEQLKAKLVDKENSFNQDDLAKLQKLLPDNVDNIRLFLDIQGIASRYGASIQDISVADQTSGQKTTGTQAIGPSSKQYSQLALAFSVSMSYENLSLFLKDLERGLRVFEIKSLGFTADDKSPDTYKVSIGLNAFWLNPTNTTSKTASSQ